jgi:hypothetical protein
MKCADELQLSSKMANRPVEFQEEATAEYEAAFDWYFERSRIAARSFPQNLAKQWQSFQKARKDGLQICTIHVDFFCGIFRLQLSIESSLQQFK